MNNNKLLGYSVILVGVILIFVIGYFAFFYEFGSEVVIESPTTDLQVNTQTPVNNSETGTTVTETKTEEEIEPVTVGQAELVQMATTFTERFGSFSSHSDYSNITDLKIFMTDNMKNWADKFLEEADYSDIYYGITTKSLNAEVDKFDEDVGVAKITVTTQRRESTGTMSNARVFNQMLVLNFMMEDGVWKVDSAEWRDL